MLQRNSTPSLCAVRARLRAFEILSIFDILLRLGNRVSLLSERGQPRQARASGKVLLATEFKRKQGPTSERSPLTRSNTVQPCGCKCPAERCP